MDRDRNVGDTQESDGESSSMSNKSREGKDKRDSKHVGSTRRVASDSTSNNVKQSVLDKRAEKRVLSTPLDSERKKRKADKG